MSIAAPPQTRTVTREQIVDLARSGKPWEFLPLALAALRQAPQDHGLRVMTAAAFSQIGLRTLAWESLAQLPAALDAEPAVIQLRRVIEAQADDALTLDARMENIESNITALGDSPAADTLRRAVPEWLAARQGTRWFIARSGGSTNIVRVAVSGAFTHLADHAAAAATFVRQHLVGKPVPDQLTIEGLDPPWLALLLASVMPRQADGFQPRLVLVQADPLEALDGLASAHLSSLLANTRTHLFVGPAAGRDLEAFLRDRLAWRTRGPLVPLLSLRTRAAQPSVGEVLHAVEAASQAEHHRLTSLVLRRAATRDRSYWAQRYMSGEPLRVLIPTTRYSTFVQHSARDLVAAFEAAGCRARLLIEPDRSSKPTTLMYLRELEAFDPDLVVMLNYFRRNLDGSHASEASHWLPDQLPMVTWLQDDMPHQKSATLGARMHALDFAVGHIEESVRKTLQIPIERTLKSPVVASSAKFHTGPITATQRERFACDVAYVSHHSETPAAMHARLCAEAGPNAAPLLERLRPAVEEIDPLAIGSDELLQLPRRVLEDSVPAEIATQLARQYVVPMAERSLRHQTLRWAVGICAKRGWRLRVMGRGWKGHPLLASMSDAAQDPVEHGDDLRACYAAARSHLHISISAPVHQRLAECALSGGLPLVRLTNDTLRDAKKAAHRKAWLAVVDADPTGTGPARLIAGDHPSLMQLIALQQRLGLPTEPFEHAHALDREWALPDRRHRVHPPDEHRADWLLGDLAELTFSSAESLEQALERAIERPAWRDNASRMIASRVGRGMTSQRFVADVLAMLRRNLVPPAAST